MNCSLTANISTEDQNAVLEISNTVLILTKFMFYAGLLLSPIALIINTCFIVASATGLRRKKIAYRLYIFLLSRSVSDFLVSLLFGTGAVLYITSWLNLKATLITLAAVTVFYWASAESYAALTIIKLIAVSKPFFYRSRITNQTCVRILVGSWALSGFYLLFQAILAETVYSKTSLRPFCSNYDSCVAD
jgi:hypothetical protein